MALTFTCDHPECDKDNLSRADVVQISVQSNDPEEGVTSARLDLCIAHGDSVVNDLSALGFNLS